MSRFFISPPRWPRFLSLFLKYFRLSREMNVLYLRYVQTTFSKRGGHYIGHIRDIFINVGTTNLTPCRSVRLYGSRIASRSESNLASLMVAPTFGTLGNLVAE